MPRNSGGREEFLVEFIPQGRYVKVTAVDPITGTESVLMGDAKFSKEALKRLAVQKLKYVLGKAE